MNGKLIAVMIVAWVSVLGLAQAQASTRHAATVTLEGDWYLQAGAVLNQSDDGIEVTGFTYSMGEQTDGAGVWEAHLGGGQHKQALAGTTGHYTTQGWTGLAVPSQSTWYFGGLDLDRIIRASTGEVDSQNLDFSGESLRHAYVQVTFSDGHRGQAVLAVQGWDVTQVLRIGEAVSPVPEPGAGLMLVVGLGWVSLRGSGRSGGADHLRWGWTGLAR